jgi:hypothetical protein
VIFGAPLALVLDRVDAPRLLAANRSALLKNWI